MLDAIDIRILRALQTDGRQTNLELANRIGLSPSPCLRRVRHLEEEGVIGGYSAWIDRERIGLGVMAFVSVSIERHRDTDADHFMKHVGSLPEVVAAYITSGESDFLLQVVVADLHEYRRFALEKLIRITGVKDIRSRFVIGTVKEERSLPLPDADD